MKFYKALHRFNAFNKDEEPQRIPDDVLLVEEPVHGWVYFYSGGARFRLQTDEFARLTESVN
jgi:hypothetical protein